MIIVDFLIIGNEYKLILKANKPNENLKIYQPRKKGSNYYLQIQCDIITFDNVKYLAEYQKLLIDKFNEKNIKYYVLLNQASEYFLKDLYPLVCQFETKLRKFITCSFIDLTEKISEPIVNYFSCIKEYDVDKNMFNTNLFLESWTLGYTFQFLFEKPNLIEYIRRFLNDNTSDKTEISVSILKNKLDNFSEKSIWDSFFADLHNDNKIPNIYNEIFKVRNSVMHFHTIDLKKYEKHKKLLNMAIKEVDKLIDKTIVIESNDDNLNVITNNIGYLSNIINAISSTNNNILSSSKILLDSLSTIKPIDISATMGNALINNILPIINDIKLPSIKIFENYSDYSSNIVKALEKCYPTINLKINE